MSTSRARVNLKPGRDKPVRRGHPWIFGGAIDLAEASTGSTVEIHDSSGEWLARGYYNPHSQIRVRVLTRDPNRPIDQAFWHQRLQESIARRDGSIVPADCNALRLVNAESDGLPGIIVDRYDSWLVVQFLALGAETAKDHIVSSLSEVAGVSGIFERSDTPARSLEGLEPSTGVLWGQPPPVPLRIEEGAFSFLVDVWHGHKTGFYLDQRDTRRLVGLLAADRSVLNCFCYTGAFTVAAAAGGARDTVSIDSSSSAIDLAVENMDLNDLLERSAQDTFVVGSAAETLRSLVDAGRTFDMVILDPPKFAHNKRQVTAAARGYKDINRLAFQLLSSGGMLATFSCSGLVDARLFQQIVFSAADEANREAHILRHLEQAADHPVSLSFPEAAYLKGLLCRAL